MGFYSLERNSIGDDGVGFLLEGLKDNKTLMTLMLGENSIGNVGASQLADYLKTSKSLREIS